jgi:hypothetical protein
VIDEPIYGLSNKLALFLTHSLGYSSQFITLALCQVDLRSHHVTPPILYTLALYTTLISCQGQRRASPAGRGAATNFEKVINFNLQKHMENSPE